MKGELLINGKDAWTTWGVCMGEGFLDSIDAPAPMKDYIENESRLEHGKRVITMHSDLMYSYYNVPYPQDHLMAL